MNLKDKNIVLGVTGSIAAYKACDIASKLVKLGSNVHVLMTENAKKFVSPLTFSSLTGNNVHDMWEDHEYKIGHIALAKLADLVLVAPATANIIAKFAYGICDDLLTTTVFATKAPVFIAPAMNTNMLENEITQDNINYLKNKGCYFIESDEGRLACGDVGKGKLANVDKIIEFLLEFQQGGSNDAPNLISPTVGDAANLIPPCRGATRKSESFFRGGVANENSDDFSTTVGDAPNPFPPTASGGTKGGEIFAEQKSILLNNSGENSVTLPNPPLRSREGVYREKNSTCSEGVTGGDNSQTYFPPTASGGIKGGDNSEESLLDRFDLLGKQIIISAGSTIAPIDPVRYISNHSSGKMGYAIAENALKRGAKVFLVAGNTSIDCSENIHLYRIKTNKEMFETVKKIIDENHIDFYISAAAPCDFRVKEEFDNKIKKKDDFSLDLTKDIDILKEISKLENHPKLIGFAAETTNLTEYANVKLKEKNLSMIVANDVSGGKVFGQDTNKATLIFANGETFETDRIQKTELAHIILDKIKDI